MTTETKRGTDIVVKTDVLVVGAGQAGFFAAIKAAEQGAKVTLVDKGYAGKSGQSQNLATMVVCDASKDDIKKWVMSDRSVNEYINNPEWVELTYRESMDRWNDLAEWGFVTYKFDKDGNVYIDSMKDNGDEYCPGEDGLGGTGEGRIASPVKFRFIVGRQHEKLRKVAQDRGVTIIDRLTVTDLIKQDGRIVGAIGFSADADDTYIFHCGAVVLAAGNGGIKTPGVRTVTTTGDAQAMAYRVGCELTGKEWTDNHPSRGDFPAYPWSSGVDRDFMVPKQKLAKNHGIPVINAEGTVLDSMRPDQRNKSTGQIFDAARMAYEAHMGRAPEFFSVDGDPNTRPMNHSPKNMPRDKMDDDAMKEGKVRMAMGRCLGQSHHLSDGVWPIDKTCATQVPGLYAAGDCLGARPGYPMAGFACAFTAVTGTRAGTYAAIYTKGVEDIPLDEAEVERLKKSMWAPMDRVGGFSPAWVNQVIINTLTPYWVLMYKSENRMQTALNTIEFIRDNVLPKLWARDVHELRLAHEVRSIVLHSEMKLKASMMRKESRWTHYREDYPLRDDKNWLCWIKIKDVDGVMTFTKEPIPKEWGPDESLPYVERYPHAFPNEPKIIPADM